MAFWTLRRANMFSISVFLVLLPETKHWRRRAWTLFFFFFYPKEDFLKQWIIVVEYHFFNGQSYQLTFTLNFLPLTFCFKIDQPGDEWYSFDIMNYVLMFIQGVVQWKWMKANSKLIPYGTDIDNQIPFIIMVLRFGGMRLRE